MERRTKHRILGMLVVIGLVILLLPLFQANNELSGEAALVAAPPFPEQPVDITSAPLHEPFNSAELMTPQPVSNKVIDATWVVQLGSFKEKSNALRIVNQLRAKGYRAFIQEITQAFDSRTRVFVGPERKQEKAHALADKLQNEIHLKGMVVRYKPLTI